MSFDAKQGGCIGREDVMLALIEKGQSSKRYKIGEFWELNWQEIMEALSAVPEADVASVRRGKWIRDQIASNIFRCSICGGDAPVSPTGGEEYESDFCPTCGAWMENGVNHGGGENG